jgi:hypothetical protein
MEDNGTQIFYGKYGVRGASVFGLDGSVLSVFGSRLSFVLVAGVPLSLEEKKRTQIIFYRNKEFSCWFLLGRGDASDSFWN